MCILHNNLVGINGNTIHFLTCFVRIPARNSVNPNIQIFQCRGVLLIWIRVGQGLTVLAVGAGGGCLDIFSLVYHFSILSPSL